MGIANMVGKLSVGPIGDKVEPTRMMAVYLLIIAVGTLCSAFAKSQAMMVAYYLLLGLGGVTTTMPVAISNYFGNASFAKNIGVAQLTTTIFSSTLPLIAGVVFDNTGTYVGVYIVAAVILVVTAALAVMVKIPKNSNN